MKNQIRAKKGKRIQTNGGILSDEVVRKRLIDTVDRTFLAIAPIQEDRPREPDPLRPKHSLPACEPLPSAFVRPACNPAYHRARLLRVPSLCRKPYRTFFREGRHQSGRKNLRRGRRRRRFRCVFSPQLVTAATVRRLLICFVPPLSPPTELPRPVDS
jgi:hypothetical protein